MKLFTLVVAVVLTAAVGPVVGMMADVPMPQIVLKSDLIAVCEILEVRGPVNEEFQPPDWGGAKARPRWVRTYKDTIHEVFRDTGKAIKLKKDSATQIDIKALSAAPPKPVQPGMIRPIMMDGPAYPMLKTGDKYLLILMKLPGEKAFYLPSYPKNYMAVTDRNKARITEVKELVDVEKWPWGKAVAGLQLAAIPTPREPFLNRTRTRRGGPWVMRTYVNVCMVMRNTSKKPISISLYEQDKNLSVSYDQEGEATRDHDLYSHLNNPRRRKRVFSDKNILTIKPGEIVLVGMNGVAHYGGLCLQLEAKLGEAKIKGAYEGKRDVPDKKLWKGRVESKPVKLEIKQRPARGIMRMKIRKNADDGTVVAP